MPSLNDLLHRADKLSTSIQTKKRTTPADSSWTTTTSGNVESMVVDGGAAGADIVQPNIDQIMRRSDILLKKKTALSSSNAAANDSTLHASLLMSKEGVTLPSLPSFMSTTTDWHHQQQQQQHVADVDDAKHRNQINMPLSIQRTQKEQMLTSIVEETLRNTMAEAERSHWRQLIHDWDEHKRSLCNDVPIVNLSQMMPTPMMSHRSEPSRSGTSMSYEQLVFAQKISEWTDSNVRGRLSESLLSMFYDAVVSLKDSVMIDLWDQVKSVLSIPIDTGKDIAVQRSSNEWNMQLIQNSTRYLEKHFLKHMETIIHGNLEQARRGGIPGNIALVQAFLNVRFPNPVARFEDGQFDGRHPVWLVVYYCIRCGDLRAAREVCRKMNLSDIGTALREIESGSLSHDTEVKLKLEYRRKVRSSTDIYKRTVYCVVAACDIIVEESEIESKLEDWLWMRLIQAKHAEEGRSTTNRCTLVALQKQIAVDYGEEHFALAGSPLMYWSSLWLTGQLETAIEFLTRQDEKLQTHVVHIAIATHQASLLITPIDCREKLLSSSPSNPTDRCLNLARLILNYTAKFESTDASDAINYYYFLRTFKSSSGDNLLETGISRLLTSSKEYDLLLGSIDVDGRHTAGLIDRFGIDSRPIISHVAALCEQNGDKLLAIKLYDLANNLSDTLRLLNDELSRVLCQPSTSGSHCERVRSIAIMLAKRYKQTGVRTDAQLTSTLYLLIDFCTFFDLYHSRRFDECIDVLRKLDCIPLHPDDVDQKVNLLHMIPDELRRVLADILLATMNTCVEQYKQLKKNGTNRHNSDIENIASIRNRAQAIILFAGMIPYRLPADTNARLVQLETFIN